MILVIIITVFVASANLYRWLTPNPENTDQSLTFRLRKDLAFAIVTLGLGLGALLLAQEVLFT